MKTLKKLCYFLIVLILPLTSFSQPELEEVPLFGTSKSIDSEKTHLITIKNKGNSELLISSVVFPEYVKISINKEKLASNESATLHITFDPTVIKKDSYSAVIKIISTEEKPGLKTTYESTYEIKGSFD